jgi:acylphosphatase
MKKHYHVFFSGTVQGVGFRYTAQSYAEKLAIYGWVANRNNGKVELDIEGESSDVNDFLSKILMHYRTFWIEFSGNLQRIFVSHHDFFCFWQKIPI